MAMEQRKKGFSFFDYYTEFETRHVHIFYKGPFKPEIVSSIANYINYALKDNPKEAKKIYKIYIELAQNISYYSAEKISHSFTEHGSGIIILEETPESFIFYAGNKTKFEDLIPVLRKCTIINDLDREQLREYKRELRELDRSSKGGANIGLITAALISENPINFDVIYINEEYCFLLLWVTINKEKIGALNQPQIVGNE